MQSNQKLKKKNIDPESSGIKNRIIGRYSGESEGPSVICIGGLHGNEPAGVAALKSVLERLEELDCEFRGELIGITGNLKALDKGERYIDEDLNRIWEPDTIDQILGGKIQPQPSSIEQLERKELIELFVEHCQKQNSPVYFVDLHTTSAIGSPFITISDTLRNRNFTKNIPVPRILGIEEQLNSTLLNYLNEWGFITIGFEAGQHDDRGSVENCIAVLWIILAHSGCLDPMLIPEYEESLTTLKSASMNDLSFYEVVYRHDIQDGDNFKMKPGYLNFQTVRKGEMLAKNFDDDITSPQNGNIFMPLYQKQGTDGFFIIRRINPFWLKLSSALRKLGVDRLLPRLPGISRENGNDRCLVVDLRIAKWYLIELLHMLGYRRKSVKDGTLIATKREFDSKAPRDYRFNIDSKNF